MPTYIVVTEDNLLLINCKNTYEEQWLNLCSAGHLKFLVSWSTPIRFFSPTTMERAPYAGPPHHL